MTFSAVESELRPNRFQAQYTRNSTSNPKLRTCHIALINQELGKKWFAYSFACKAQNNNAQFETEILATVIRWNLEVLGFGE